MIAAGRSTARTAVRELRTRFMYRKPVMSLLAVLALIGVELAAPAAAIAAPHALRNYYASQWRKNAEGYNVVWASMVPKVHCDDAPYNNSVDFTFQGSWVSTGNSYIKRVTIRNYTAQYFVTHWFRVVDSGGYFDIPRVSLAPGQSWTYTVNRTITGSWSNFAFGSRVADAPCGNAGRSEWVVRP
jgi:hypothetical protein